MRKFTKSVIVQKTARWIIRLEPLLLLVITLVFWYPAPPRDQWLWLLWLWLPVAVARWILFRRLWIRTPLDIFFLAFVGLGVLNIHAAPYTRGSIMLGRPLQGMFLYVFCTEYARTRGKINALLAVTLVLTLVVGTLALTSTQWALSATKTSDLQFITDHLPAIDWDNILPGAGISFNPNEIGGALAWLCPLAGGIMIYSWRFHHTPMTRFAVTGAFLLSFGGLFLGQSRFALTEVFVSLTILTALLLPRGRWFYGALTMIGFLIVSEALIVLNLFSPVKNSSSAAAPTAGISARDESSLNKRFSLWESGLKIIHDYPLTGVGMAMYRDGRVRKAYPAPGLTNPPHAHNEVIQVGTDLGLPGLAVYIAWHVGIGWMLFRVWKQGSLSAKAVAASVTGGLLAHAIFGIGDAITLWDRFAFVYWWLLGLAGAQYVLVCQMSSGQHSPATDIRREATPAIR